jgi:hypothetical protein
MDKAPDKTTDKTSARTVACDLPLRADVPLEARVTQPPHKDIHKTIGGRLTHAGIYYLLGFVGNSGLSIGITYLLNPREWVKNLKKPAAEAMEKVLKGFSKDPLRMAHRTVEIGFMMIAGTILTAAMVPLVKRRERIAYWINQKLGTDKDVLPDHLVKQPEPRTLEEKIEQEINKRVNKQHSSGDLWSARWTALAVPLFGEMALSNWNSKREKAGQWSVDTKIVEGGTKLYDKVLSKKSWVDKLSRFFEKHGASMEEMQKNAPENYKVLAGIENKLHPGELNKSRMMIADQSRMLSKEVGWTIILAVLVDRLVRVFHNRRVKREEKKAIAEITKEGFVPEGYKVVLGEGVTLQPVGGTAGEKSSWAEKNAAGKPRPEKTENFVKTVDNSRSTAGEQPALG